MSVTVVIPHIIQRAEKLRRALASVKTQTWEPNEVIVMTAEPGEPVASVRNRALDAVDTKWIAWLDDDDEFLPQHIATLLQVAHTHRIVTDDANIVKDLAVVYPACRVLDPAGRSVPIDPTWGRPGYPFDADLLRRMSYIPITSLCRTDIARQARFDVYEHYDDWGFYLRILELGGNFAHVNEVTWVWHHDGGNTSGKPGKGDLA